MPHIVKWSERCKLVKPKCDDWSQDLKLKYYPPPAISSDKFIDMRRPSRESLFSLIEQLIDETLPKAMNNFFEEFVDIKEVPYGRHNSDTDYRGSGTELS